MSWFSKKSSDAPKPSDLKISDYLTEKTITFFTAGPSKQQVLGQLLAHLDLADPSAALKAILAREETGGTIIAPGFAIPHARLHGLKKLKASMGIIPAGVVDPRAKGEPVKIYLLFIGSADNIKEHLAFLAAVSTHFEAPGVIEKILQQNTPADVLKLL